MLLLFITTKSLLEKNHQQLANSINEMIKFSTLIDYCVKFTNFVFCSFSLLR